MQNYVSLYCAERQIRRNHNHRFCLRNLSFVNNTESIPNSPKDFVVCKRAFLFAPPLVWARSMDAAVAGGGVGGWLVHWEQCRVRNGKVAASSFLLCSQGRQILAVSFPLFLCF